MQRDVKQRNLKGINPLSPYRRIFMCNHYQKKGLTFEVFMRFVLQDCHYCQAAPALVNPVSSNYDTCATQVRRETWEKFWVPYNGIDKKEPGNDYLDESNLLPCCKQCNWLKGLMGYDEFIAHVKKIAANFSQ